MSKDLPDNVIPLDKTKRKEKEKDQSTEGVNLEEQNKERYKKLQEAAKARRTIDNRNVTRNYNLTPRNPDRRDRD